jgi:hypothetical protein
VRFGQCCQPLPMRKENAQFHAGGLCRPGPFVECERFRGTCYRAANWTWLGQTQGRGRNDHSRLSRVPIKDIYVRALCKDFRQRLTQGFGRCS